MLFGFEGLFCTGLIFDSNSHQEEEEKESKHEARVWGALLGAARTASTNSKERTLVLGVGV